MWQIKTFDELTVNELYRILYLRTATFVVDQKRIYQEVDNRDQKAIHIFDLDASGRILAYARVFPINHGQAVSFGRVVTSKKVRGQGVGGQLLKRIMQVIRKYYPNKKISIESQVQVQGFYRQAGFKSEGKAFIYKSTPHIKMVHAPLKKKG